MFSNILLLWFWRVAPVQSQGKATASVWEQHESDLREFAPLQPENINCPNLKLLKGDEQVCKHKH